VKSLLSIFQKYQFPLEKIVRHDLHHHIHILTKHIGERNSTSYQSLTKAYHYIYDLMKRCSTFNIFDQRYEYEGNEYHNLVAEKIGSTKPEEIIIIGAHYDTALKSPGADDNGSGIAALLELIKWFDNYENERTLRFIAFTLEEPPVFGTPNMGSYVYANSCQQKQEKILAMFCLEMLAYFSNKKGSQRFFSPELKARFPDKGNFISIVGDLNSKILVETLTELLKKTTVIPVEPLVAYQPIKGINFSDHASFWSFGYRAVMITDTAFYRNNHYHEPSDTVDTLNFNLFAKLVVGLHAAFIGMDKSTTLSV
jgi:hypothetical protein